MIFKYFLRRYRRKISLATLLSAAAAGISLMTLSHINEIASRGTGERPQQDLLFGLALLTMLFVVSSTSQFLLARIGADLVAEMRLDLSKQLVQLDYENMARGKSFVFGALIQDISRIAPLVLVAPHVAYNSLIVVLCSIYLLNISIPLSIIFIIFIATTLAVSLFVERKTRVRFDFLRQAEDRVIDYFRAISDGKKELSLSSSRTRHFFESVLTPEVRLTQHLMTNVHLRWGINDAWSNTTFYGAIFLIVFVGSSTLSIPSSTIVSFVIGAFFLLGPITFLAKTGQQFGSGMASLRHLQSIGLYLRSEISNQPLGTEEACIWANLRVANVTYSYPCDDVKTFTIGPIDINIQKGETVFFVGQNGSGKSTLLLLLCGLLQPKSGQILLDNEPILDRVGAFRDKFGGVFGDFFLFPDVIDSDGVPLSDAQIEVHLNNLGLGSSVTSVNGRLSKLSLSTGQRKRLALLHCYAEDREILIFDEWAADQDVEFRHHFYSEILPELKRRGKTILVVSHDDRYFHIADRVVELRKGQIQSDVLNKKVG